MAPPRARLTAGNGLLLTPSIDQLFDRGFISFDDSGDTLISPIADKDSQQRMGVNLGRPPRVGGFNSDQVISSSMTGLRSSWRVSRIEFSRPRIPDAEVAVFDLPNEDDVVRPRQLGNGPLPNLSVSGRRG